MIFEKKHYRVRFFFFPKALLRNTESILKKNCFLLIAVLAKVNLSLSQKFVKVICFPRGQVELCRIWSEADKHTYSHLLDLDLEKNRNLMYILLNKYLV